MIFSESFKRVKYSQYSITIYTEGFWKYNIMKEFYLVPSSDLKEVVKESKITNIIDNNPIDANNKINRETLLTLYDKLAKLQR